MTCWVVLDKTRATAAKYFVRIFWHSTWRHSLTRRNSPMSKMAFFKRRKPNWAAWAVLPPLPASHKLTEINFPADKTKYRLVMTMYFIALPSVVWHTAKAGSNGSRWHPVYQLLPTTALSTSPLQVTRSHQLTTKGSQNSACQVKAASNSDGLGGTITSVQQ